ncbi:hypothetical protein [Pontixanthobacter luteolus]|uniref:hypothetical protein n=1 Tax=Pontixanthobacter luteolus TaxID=295089 RepID=UPI0023046F3B|nr:hypothetical protein [Pontixanthobacter luteolus]
MSSRTAAITLLPLALCAAGCASSGKTYPSLAIRDAERVSGTLPVGGVDAVQMAPSPLPGDLIGRIAALESSARESHQRFLAAAPDARGAVRSGRNAAVASNSWASAQVALADLDSIRSLTAIALGDLDLIFTDATLDFVERGQIAQARDKVLAMVREEDAVLAELRGGAQ